MKTRTLLERRARRAARAALYVSLGVVGAVLAACLLYMQSLEPEEVRFEWQGVDFASIPEVQLFQRYLRIDTAQPNANELAGARFLAGELEKAGIPASIEILGGTHANVIAVLEGESREALVLHHHIDTDPVPTPGEWTFPPFSGTINPPYIYGRGAYDMKSIGIAQLAAVLDLKASGIPLKRSVVFLATGSEEVGSDLGTRWVLARHPELASRFWAFLTEGGVVETRSAEEILFWGIEVAQKRYVDVVLCSGSREPLEALHDELLEERELDNFEVRLTPEVREFLEVYAPSRHRELFRRALEGPESLRLEGPTWAELPHYLKAMFRDEALPFPVRAEAGGGFSLLVKLHLLPGSDAGRAIERFLPPWRTAGFERSVYDEGGADHGSPTGNEVFRAMVEALTEAHPGAPVGPHFLPWTATDSRFARAAGIPAYGFSPFLLYIAETGRIGQVDERLSLPVFVDGVEIYRRLVRRLVQ